MKTIKNWWRAAALVIVAAALVTVIVTNPKRISEASLSPRTPDLTNGRAVFDASGCASCHATPGQDDRAHLGGGLPMHTPFGTFKVPNISMDAATGIGTWSESDFLSAVLKGTGRRGEHLYPAFPYTAYQYMSTDDARDLFGYMRTLPAVARKSEPHEVSFPFNVRLLLGGWKLISLEGSKLANAPGTSAELRRGAYLTEALAHCAECHSARNIFGGIQSGTRYAGGLTPDGKGWVPNITPHADGLAEWTLNDLVYFLETGNTPSGFPVDEEMGKVIANTSRMTPQDRMAMAYYLKSLPAIPGKRPAKK
jgi:mono/diheme cytochrome c family protein